MTKFLEKMLDDKRDRFYTINGIFFHNIRFRIQCARKVESADDINRLTVVVEEIARNLNDISWIKRILLNYSPNARAEELDKLASLAFKITGDRNFVVALLSRAAKDISRVSGFIRNAMLIDIYLSSSRKLTGYLKKNDSPDVPARDWLKFASFIEIFHDMNLEPQYNNIIGLCFDNARKSIVDDNNFDDLCFFLESAIACKAPCRDIIISRYVDYIISITNSAVRNNDDRLRLLRIFSDIFDKKFSASDSEVFHYMAKYLSTPKGKWAKQYYFYMYDIRWCEVLFRRAFGRKNFGPEDDGNYRILAMLIREIFGPEQPCIIEYIQ